MNIFSFIESTIKTFIQKGRPQNIPDFRPPLLLLTAYFGPLQAEIKSSITPHLLDNLLSPQMRTSFMDGP